MGKGARKGAHTHPDYGLKLADHYQDELDGCRVTLGTKTQELTEAKRSVANLNEALSSSKLSQLSLERRIEQLDALVLTREAEVRAAKANAEAAEKLLHETPSLTMIAAHREDADRLRLRDAQLTDLTAKLGAARNDLERKETEVKALKVKERDLEWKLQESYRMMQDQPGQLAALRRTNDQLRTRVEELDRRANHAERDGRRVAADLEQALSDLKVELEHALNDQLSTAERAELGALRTLRELTYGLALDLNHAGYVMGRIARPDNPHLVEEVDHANEHMRGLVKGELHQLPEPTPPPEPKPGNGKSRWLTGQEAVKSLLAERPMTLAELVAASGKTEGAISAALHKIGLHSSAGIHSGPGKVGTYALPTLK